MTDAVRERFERWMSEDGKWPDAVAHRYGHYVLAHTESAWKAWQAALSEQPAIDMDCGRPAPAGTPSEDARDAARYRWLRSQHEVDDERASDNNYGKSYPPRTMTVFVDDGHDGLDPLPCDPGALDAAIDAALSGEQP